VKQKQAKNEKKALQPQGFGLLLTAGHPIFSWEICHPIKDAT